MEKVAEGAVDETFERKRCNHFVTCKSSNIDYGRNNQETVFGRGSGIRGPEAKGRSGNSNLRFVFLGAWYERVGTSNLIPTLRSEVA